MITRASLILSLLLATSVSAYADRYPTGPELIFRYQGAFISSRAPDGDLPVGNQGVVGAGVEVEAVRVGPMRFGISGFAGRSHGPDPVFTQVDLGFLVGVDGWRERGVGFGLYVRPVFSWWTPNTGGTVTDPGLRSEIADLPQIILQVGSATTWVELAAGGRAEALDPRIGRFLVHWMGERLHWEFGFAVLTAPKVGTDGVLYIKFVRAFQKQERE